VGDLVRTPITLAIPARLPKTLRLVVSLVDPSDQPIHGWGGWLPIPQDALTLDTVAVEDWPLETTVSAYSTPVEAEIGPARLRGYSLTPAEAHSGDTLTVSLVWQVTKATDTSYKVFIHLLDTDGKPRAQVDAFPVNGTRPTSGWRPGEALKDDYQLTLPADLAPGVYRLAAGLYRPEDGVRAPATRGGQPVANDLVELGTVQVTR
jgi:hypothetical protein